MTFDGRRVLVVEDEFLVSLATTDLLESIGCEVVGPAARLATAVQLAQSESLDAAVLDIDIAGEAVWPVALELQQRSVPFLFLSVHSPLRVFPARFAIAPRLGKPLVQRRLLDYLSAIWGASVDQATTQHLASLPRAS